MKTDTMWNRLLKAVLPASYKTPQPMDTDRNSNTLGRLEENDPTLVCVRDHLFTQFSNELATALDRQKPVAERISALDSASGLVTFIEDLELRRQGWNEERIRRLREEAARKGNKN